MSSGLPVRRVCEMARAGATAMFDVFAMYQAFLAAYALRASDARPLAVHMTVHQFATVAGLCSPLWVAIFAFNGLYSNRADRGRLRELTGVVLGVSGGTMALIVLNYLWGGEHNFVFPSRAIPVYGFVFGVVLVLLGRAVVRAGTRSLQARGIGVHNVLLVGSGPRAERLAEVISRTGARVVAVVSHERGTAGAPLFSSMEDALAGCRHRIDEILHVDPATDRADIARAMSVANARGISYRFVPDQYGIYAAASTMATIDGVPVMEVRLTSLDGWGRVGKRLFDLVGSLLLAVVVLPVIGALAAIIKLREPDAPVFYRHTRLGQGGREIGLWKLRSMRWEYSTGPDRPYLSAVEVFRAMDREDLVAEFLLNQKVADDPRVDWFGSLLRRTSLDELPQLLNALRGDLSLVGPRPITAEELERYGDQTASLLALKPGITGLWQVSGRSSTCYGERVKLDVSYIENWNPLLDLSILVRTLPAVVGRRGAI